MVERRTPRGEHGSKSKAKATENGGVMTIIMLDLTYCTHTHWHDHAHCNDVYPILSDQHMYIVTLLLMTTDSVPTTIVYYDIRNKSKEKIE
jgi:hypothetical protein